MKKILKRSFLALVIILAMIAAVGLAVYAAETDSTSAVASATVGGETKYYDSLSEAITNADDGSTVYVHRSITGQTGLVVKGKTLTITSAGAEKYSIANSKNAMFYLIDGATLTLQNLSFSGCDNFIMYGRNKPAGYYDATKNNYTMNFENIEVSFAASGAIYSEGANKVEITIKNSIFSSRNDFSAGNAILNSGSGKDTSLSLSLSGLVKIRCQNLNSGSVTPSSLTDDTPTTFSDDAAAVAKGFCVKLGESASGGAVGTVYFTSISDAVASASSGDTIYIIGNVVHNNKVVLDNKNIIIEGDDKYTILPYATSGVTAFSLKNGSDLTLNNLIFKGLASANLIEYANDNTKNTSDNCEYTITLNNIDCYFSAGGAISSCAAKSATITINDSYFEKNDSSTLERAVVNIAYKSDDTTKISFNNVETEACNKLNSASKTPYESISTGKKYPSIDLAVKAGAVAKIGDVTEGRMEEVFFTNIADAVAKAKSGDIIYVIADIGAHQTVTINDGRKITIIGKEKYTITSAAAKAFDIQNGSGLTLENLKFNDLNGKNLIDYQKGNINITIKNVDVEFCSASGAIYGRAVDSADITIENSTFRIGSGEDWKTERAIINPTAGNVNLTFKNVKNIGCNKVNISSGKATITKAIVTDNNPVYNSIGDAVSNGAVAMIGEVTSGKLDEVFFTTIDDAIRVAKETDTIYLLPNAANKQNLGYDLAFSTAYSFSKKVTIKGYNGQQITVKGYAEIPAFRLHGGATLELEDIIFTGFSGKNLVVVGEGEYNNFKEYTLKFTDVTVKDFKAGGAINLYNAEKVTIYLTNCDFSSTRANDGVINFGGTQGTSALVKACEMIIHDLVLDTECELFGINVVKGRVNTTATYTNDDAAKFGKVLQNRDDTYLKLEVNDESGDKVYYFYEYADYIEAKKELNPGENVTVNSTYNVVYSENAFKSNILTTMGINIATGQFIQAGHDYKGAWEIAKALYGTKNVGTEEKPIWVPNKEVDPIHNVVVRYNNGITGNSVFVGVRDKTNKDTEAIYADLIADEYAIFVDDNGDVYLLAWNDKALNAAVNTFIGMVKENKVTLAPGVYTYRASENWIVDFTKPTDEMPDATQYVNNNSVQYVYKGTAEDFESYIDTLIGEGYEILWDAKKEGNVNNQAGSKNRFVMLKNAEKGIALYVAYNDFTYKDVFKNDFAATVDDINNCRTEFDACIRIVAMPAEMANVPVNQGTTQNVTGLKPDAKTFIKTVGVNKVGMSYIIALEDGRFIVVDGGQGHTGGSLWKALVEAYDEMYEEKWSEGKKITIAAWYLTHGHGDHWYEFYYMMSPNHGNHATDIILQNVIINGIDEYSISLYEAGQTTFMSSERVGIETLNIVIDWYNKNKPQDASDCNVVKVHTGQTFSFANVEFEVLMTFEDHLPIPVTNSNDTNTVIRMNIKTGENTTSILFLGDSQINASRYLAAMYGSYLKSDIVQLAHHGNVGVEALLYKLISADIVLVPNKGEGGKNGDLTDNWNGDSYKVTANNAAKKIAKYVWFAGTSTGDKTDTVLHTNTLYIDENGPDIGNYNGEEIENYSGCSKDHEHTFEKKPAGEFHYDECNDCNAIKDLTEHSYTTPKHNETYHWNECACGAKDVEVEHTAVNADNDCTTATVCTCGHVIEAAKTHDFTGEWNKDDAGHWHVCKNDGCNVTDTKAGHTASNADTDCTTATVCTCGHVIEAAKTHDFTGEWNKDDAGHWHVCKNDGCNVTDTKAGHTASNADTDCTTATVCACGYEMVAAKTHDFTGAWNTDAEGHWHVCANDGCEVTDTKADHTAANADTNCTTATNCSCGYEMEAAKAHDFTGEWKSDAEGHWHVCKNAGCEATDTKAGHQSSGAATETTAETCTVCNYEIAPSLDHVHKNNLTPVEKYDPADCTTDGYKAHYKCSCGKYYEDADATIVIDDIAAWKAGAGKIAAEHLYGDLIPAAEAVHTKTELKGAVAAHYHCVCGEYFTENYVKTTLADLTSAAPTHDTATKGKNTVIHWDICSVCGLEQNVAEHTGGEATCKDKAVCTVCETAYGELADHNYGELISKEEVHTEDRLEAAVKPHYHCDVCDGYFDQDKTGPFDRETFERDFVDPTPTHDYVTAKFNATEHWNECSCGKKGVVEAHKGGTADCQNKAVCEVCDQAYGEKDLTKHVFDIVNGYTGADGHANTCKCGEVDTVVAHTPNIEAATETQAKVCTVCNYEIEAMIGHVHADHLTAVEEQDSTCTTDGYKAYYKCSCGNFYEDEAATKQIANLENWKANAGKIAAGHKYGDLIEAEDAIHTIDELKAGVDAHYHCVCGKYFTEDKVETTLEELTGETPVHAFGGWVTTDSDRHWKECECGMKVDLGAHVYSDKFLDETCNTCGHVREITHVHGSKVEKFEGKAATETEAGYKEYYRCECGYYYADEACTIRIEDVEAWKNGEGRLIPLGEIVFTPEEFGDEVADIFDVITSTNSPIVIIKQATRFVTAVIGLLTKIFG